LTANGAAVSSPVIVTLIWSLHVVGPRADGEVHVGLDARNDGAWLMN
jgi:hypothetical protein